MKQAVRKVALCAICVDIRTASEGCCAIILLTARAHHFIVFVVVFLNLRGAEPSFAEHLIDDSTNDKTKFNCWTIECCEENTDEFGDLIQDKIKDYSFLSFISMFRARQTQISGGEEVGIEKLGFIDALHFGQHPKESQQMQL